MNEKDILCELSDEITDIEEALNKTRTVSWCLMSGYFLKDNPDKNILIVYYEQYKELFLILDDYLVQMKLMFEKLHEKIGE